MIFLSLLERRDHKMNHDSVFFFGVGYVGHVPVMDRAISTSNGKELNWASSNFINVSHSFMNSWRDFCRVYESLLSRSIGICLLFRSPVRLECKFKWITLAGAHMPANLNWPIYYCYYCWTTRALEARLQNVFPLTWTFHPHYRRPEKMIRSRTNVRSSDVRRVQFFLCVFTHFSQTRIECH